MPPSPKRSLSPVTLGPLSGFEYESDPLRVCVAVFSSNGRLAVYLNSTNGMLYTHIAVNVPELPISSGEFLAKVYGENEELREPLLNSGWFEDTGMRAEGGFVTLELWRLTELGRQHAAVLLEVEAA